MEYASIHWRDHVTSGLGFGLTDWDSVEADIFDPFASETSSLFYFWTYAWIHFQKFELEFEHTGILSRKEKMPSRLHWAALFSLENICWRLISEGLDVHQQSVFGKLMNCALIREYASYEYDQVSSGPNFVLNWRTPVDGVMRMLCQSGADL